MPVPTTYFTSTRNVATMFGAIQKAGVPEKFSHTFLKNLGFTSSSDRPLIPMLRALRFIDDTGAPTERYRRYKDRPRAKEVLAEALRDTYSELFAIDQEAHKKTVKDLDGMFARLSEKGESVVSKMAGTFKVLAELADFTAPQADDVDRADEADEAPGPEDVPPPQDEVGRLDAIRVHHDIHIHLPATLILTCITRSSEA